MQLRAMFVAAFGFAPCHINQYRAWSDADLWVVARWMGAGWGVVDIDSDHRTPTAALRAWCRACDADDATGYVLDLYRAELARLEAMS